jgi:4'-phosphopantetheinyl transferase
MIHLLALDFSPSSPVHHPSWTTQSLDSPLPLPEGEAHVWKLPLDTPPDNTRNLLSPAERERHAGFRHSLAALRYWNTRSLTRQILAAYLQQPPGKLEICQARGGKPYLRDHPLEFNLSHSRGLGLLAVSAGQPLGVDLEQLRPVKYLAGIAARIFDRQAMEELRHKNERDSQQLFFRHWTAMEARQKAQGRGIFAERVPAGASECQHFIPHEDFIATIVAAPGSALPALRFLEPRYD